MCALLTDVTARMPRKSAPLAAVMQGGPALAGVLEAVRTAKTADQVGELLVEARNVWCDNAEDLRRALAGDDA